MNEKERKNILGLRIMQRRKALGITQRELAEKIGVSDNQVSNIETGRCYPRMNNFIKICEIFGVNADYLLTGTMQQEVSADIMDLISICTPEEQRTIWKLLDSYVHRDDDERI